MYDINHHLDLFRNFFFVIVWHVPHFRGLGKSFVGLISSLQAHKIHCTIWPLHFKEIFFRSLNTCSIFSATWQDGVE